MFYTSSLWLDLICSSVLTTSGVGTSARTRVPKWERQNLIPYIHQALSLIFTRHCRFSFFGALFIIFRHSHFGTLEQPDFFLNKNINSSKTCLIWIKERLRNILIYFLEVHSLDQPSINFKSLNVVLPFTSAFWYVPPKHAQKLKLKLKQVIEVSKSAHVGRGWCANNFYRNV